MIMAELPFDVITSQILSRLPAKSVVRCKCVCKQWLYFLSTQEFARMHCRNMTTAHNHKLLTIDRRRSCSIQTIDYESLDHASTKIIRSVPFKVRRPSDVLVLASLDGLVCACLSNTSELVIWNPLTGACNKLSNSKSQGFYKPYSDAVGFYKDGSSNDYRIMHIKQRRRSDIRVYIYSQRSDSWRKIRFLKKHRCASYHYLWSSGTFSGDSLYFTVYTYWMAETVIIGFDVNSEKFKEIRFPGVKANERCRGHLVNVENCIHLFATYGFHSREYDLWRMEGEKWLKVAVIPGVENIMTSWPATYVVSKDRWLVLWHYKADVYEIDMKTKDYICVYPGNMLKTLQRAIYIETLVSPSL
ncbi:hypothetical protein QVD17_26229 [Tagetes erecta]|uniref:F-box domain-containing protein n=1 Tax=Tagetes erecta TaxID=13708 RepID=A0AAD8NQ49_TARER|nr:hypothetical protein QVD17_26229 [Tagetes erecta]